MRVLLDTHLLLWWQADDERLSAEARQLILSAEAVVVSSVSVWEVGIKHGLGKLSVGAARVWQTAQEDGFVGLPFTALHALAVTELPDLHKDPFDRALVSQSLNEPLILLTADAQVAQYGGTVRRV